MEAAKKSTVPYPKLPHIRYFIMRLKRSSTTSHIHEAFEIMLVLEGACRLIHGQSTTELKAGDFAVVNPNQVHYFESNDNDVCILELQLSSYFGQDYFPDFRNIEYTNPLVKNTKSSKYEDLKKHFCAAALCYFSADNYNQYRCVSLTSYLIQEMMDQIPFRLRSDSDSLNEAKLSKRMQRILTYIQDHFAEPHLLSDIAKQEGLTPSYISRLFSSNFNMTFQKYLMQLRLENAMRLLCTTNLPIFDICYECGFSDYRQLNRYCNDHYGKSASACRSLDLINTSTPIIPSRNLSVDYDRFTDEASLAYLNNIPGIREFVIRL